MFSATTAGATASAALYSIVETGEANKLNTYDYLTLIFKELPKAKTLEGFEKLLPYNKNLRQTLSKPELTPSKATT